MVDTRCPVTYFFLTATTAVWASIRFLSSRCLITTGRSIDRKRSLIIPWTESGSVVHFVLIVRSAICRVRGFNIANLLRSCSPSCWSGPSSDRCFRFGGMTAVRWSGLGVLIQMSDQAHNMNCKCQYCFGLSSRSHAGIANLRQDLIYLHVISNPNWRRPLPQALRVTWVSSRKPEDRNNIELLSPCEIWETTIMWTVWTCMNLYEVRRGSALQIQCYLPPSLSWITVQSSCALKDWYYQSVRNALTFGLHPSCRFEAVGTEARKPGTCQRVTCNNSSIWCWNPLYTSGWLTELFLAHGSPPIGITIINTLLNRTGLARSW